MPEVGKAKQDGNFFFFSLLIHFDETGADCNKKTIVCSKHNRNVFKRRNKDLKGDLIYWKCAMWEKFHKNRFTFQLLISAEQLSLSSLLFSCFRVAFVDFSSINFNKRIGIFGQPLAK